MSKYINAEELIRFCTSMLVETKDDEIIQAHNNAFRRMRKYIKFLPSADVVEVKHGEWIEETLKMICPFCDTYFSTINIPNERFKELYYFCPHCGADMRGEK